MVRRFASSFSCRIREEEGERGPGVTLPFPHILARHLPRQDHAQMPSTPITIRPATPADFPAAARIYVLAEDDVMRRQHDRPSQLDDPDMAADEALARYDLRLFHEDNPAQVQIAVSADRPDEILGFAAFWIRDHWWYLDYLYVHPDAQNHGIGRALIEHCHALGRDAGCTVFSLFASPIPAPSTAISASASRSSHPR